MQSNPNKRERVLTAVEQFSEVPEASNAEIRQEAESLLAMSANTRDQLMDTDLVTAFQKRVETGLILGCTCDAVSTQAEISTSVRRYLQSRDLPPAIVAQPHPYLESVEWGSISTDNDIHEEGSVSVCMAEYGIAESGSVVVHSGDRAPVLLNFLCSHQIYLLKRSSVLPYLDDYGLLANAIAESGATPRNMCLVTGASGTTDIEGVLVKGAHGPQSVHVILIDQE